MGLVVWDMSWHLPIVWTQESSGAEAWLRVGAYLECGVSLCKKFRGGI